MKVTLREKELKSGAKSLYLDIYHNGQRSYEFLDIKIDPSLHSAQQRKEHYEVANLIRANRESDLITSGTGYVPERKRKVSFTAYFQSYVNTYQKKDVRMIKGSLKQFNEFADSKVYQMREVTPGLCSAFMDYLKSDKARLSGETPKNYFTRFKKVLSAATSEGYFPKNPANDITFRYDDSDNLKKQVLTADEMKTLLNTKCGNDEVKRAFLFACNTGLGAAEIRQLTWADLADNRLKVTRKKVDTQVIHIPLSKTAIALLGEKGKRQEKVFSLEQSDNAINKVLRHWIDRAGIDKHITFYCGRHTFAVQLLSNGANLKTVADCMGHSSTKHTIKYLNFVDSLRDAAINSLPDLFTEA